jgi:hypothetical protein
MVRRLADALLRKADEHKLERSKAGSPISPPSRQELGLPPRLAAVFAPVDSRALGTAVGLTLGALVAMVTTCHIVVQPPHAPNIGLLAHYFYGYSVSPQGIGVGFIWGCVTGVVLGWLAGAVRNAILRLTLTLVHRGASLGQPFLDDLS